MIRQTQTQTLSAPSADTVRTDSILDSILSGAAPVATVSNRTAPATIESDSGLLDSLCAATDQVNKPARKALGASSHPVTRLNAGYGIGT